MAGFWHVILGGALAGLLLAFLIGPVFFALITTRIEKGFIPGILFAMGISLSDATFFLLAFLGISQIEGSEMIHKIMGTFGGFFLVIFGISLIVKRRKEILENSQLPNEGLWKNFAKGFFVNALNPSVMLYWVGVVSAVSAQYQSDHQKIFFFFLTTLIVLFCIDMVKSYLAFRLKNFITAKVMKWINRFSGTLLIIGGIKLLYDAASFYLF